nr:MAG TPA: hypothetical protein [Caudoviricetes sp.]
MFKKCKHIRLLKWFFYFLNWLLFPVLPSLYLIIKYSLYTKLSGGSKFQFLFILLITLCAYLVVKWFVSESKLTDAKSEKEYRIRFFLSSLFDSLKYVLIIFLFVYIIKGVSSFNEITIENIKGLLITFFHIIGFKLVQIWVNCFTIKPVELTIKFRQGAFIKKSIDEQSEFV